MVIKLLSNQVPKLWDAIKWAAVKSDRMNENDIPLYLNRLLIALLNDKAQCFVRLDDNRELLAIAITRIVQDEVTGEKTLFWNHLYSFKLVGQDQWAADKSVIVNFAKQNGCKKITLYTNSPRVMDIVTLNGFTERYRCFVAEV